MRWPTAVLALLLAAGAAVAEPRPALRAERITARTAPELVIGGPDAIGGVGDWYLANDVIEVIVDDPGRAYATLNHGGTIVDVGLRDRRGEDQFARLWPLVNLDQRVFIGYRAIEAEVNEGGWARLVVSSDRMQSLPRGGLLDRWLDWLVPDPEALRGLRAETEYAVFPGEPFVHITTTLHNDGDRPAPVFALGDVWMRGGRSMRAFVGNVLAPERSYGFHHVNFDRTNLFRSSEALAAFTHVSVPGMRPFPPIAYALFSPERTRAGLVQFGVTGKHVNLVNAFVGDPDWRELDVLHLAGATFAEIEPGERWVYTRRLLVTGRADVASTTDVIFPSTGVADGTSGLEGRVEPAGAPCVIQVDAAESGAPFTEIATETEGPEAGRYRATLPPGRYRLRFRSPQRDWPSRDVEVVAGRFTPVATQRLGEPGWLRFGEAFADGGPGRIVVRGVGATPDPVFEPELLDFRLDGRRVGSGSESNQLYFIGNAHDPERLAIPPGRYELTATRGLEWGAARRRVEVPEAGDEVRVEPFALRRATRLGGWVSADLHVHAQASDDSAMPNERRLSSYLAEGIDVMVTTDHDRLGFFEPAIERLGVAGRIRVVQGVEATSSGPSPAAPWTIGHSNAWPLRYDPFAHRRGAPPTQNVSLADLYARLRRDYGARVVQLNHPRDGKPGHLEEGAFLTHLGNRGEPFRPELPIDEEPNRALLELAADGRTRGIDFDAIEVMNGSSFAQYRLIRRDWYALLRQGYRRTGTANSDSHGPGELAGYPRNYLRLEASGADGGLSAAVRQGRAFGTNGPLLVDFRVNGGRAGDLVGAADGRARVELAVAAAPWVPVDEVRLLVNGEVARRWSDLPRRETDTVMRLRRRQDLALAADAFVTLEAGAPLEAEPAAWAASHPGLYADVLAPGFVPAAFSNPVWVDVDGNGRFDAPGLPPPPPDWRRAALWGGSLLGLCGLVVWRARAAHA